MRAQKPNRLHVQVGHCGLIVSLLFVLVLVASALAQENLSGKISGQLSAIKKAGYPVNLDELDKWYSASADGANAASVYAGAFSSLHTSTLGSIKLPQRGTAMTADTKQAIAGLVTENQPAIELLHKAAVSGKCRYQIDLKKGVNMELPHLAGLRDSGRLLLLNAAFNLEQGKVEASLQSITDTLGAALSLEDEPLLLSQLVRIALEKLSVSALERVLSQHGLEEKQIAIAASAFRNAECPMGLHRAFVGERCTGINLFQMSPQNRAAVFSKTSEGAARFKDNAQSVDGDFLFFLRIMESETEVTKLPYPKRLQAAKDVRPEIIRSAKEQKYLVSAQLLPAFGSVVEKDAENVALLRAARTALAVERFRFANRKLPENLDSIAPSFLDAIPVDPFDGKSIRFKKLAKGYVVYSVGKDTQDNGGKEKGDSETDYDLTLTVER